MPSRISTRRGPASAAADSANLSVPTSTFRAELPDRAGRVAAALLLFVGAVVQLLTLAAAKITWTSDEGIVALMGLHISRGQARPIFCYGSFYGGTLEPHYLAGMFSIFGASVGTFRASLILLLALLTALVWAIGRRTLGSGVALAAAVYLTVPPFFYLYKGLTSDGVYVTLALLGAGILYVAIRLDQSLGRGEPTNRWIVVLGVIAGLGWWVTPLIAYFYVAVLLWFVLVRRAVFRRPMNYLLFLLSFGVGSLPWWVANVRNSWRSLTDPALAPVSAIPSGENFLRFWTAGVPVLFGARPHTLAADSFPGASFVAIALFGIPVVLSAAAALRRAIAPSGPQWVNRSEARYLVLFLLSILSMYLTVSWNPDTYIPEPRYLFPIYVPFSLLVGFTIVRVMRGVPAFVVVLATAALVVFHVVGIARAPVQDDFLNLPTTGRAAPLVRALEDRGLHDVYAGYWTAYRLAFESQERIRAATFGTGTDRADRYPAYAIEVARSNNPAVVLRGEDLETFAEYLRNRGAPHKLLRMGLHVVFWDLPPDVVEQIRLLRSPPPPDPLPPP